MQNVPDTPWFDRLVAPGALFLGLAASFLGCCLAGRLASRRNHIQAFERFHIYLTPETLFYPTACQVRRLAQSRLDPRRIAVVVGGSSVLKGDFQRPTGVWTRKLQALLGERFQVINLALSGACAAEFGAVAAEVLQRDYPRLILITDVAPGCMFPDPDGRLFKYFFWDACCKGLLLPHPDRDRRLREQCREAVDVAAIPGWPGTHAAGLKGEEQVELRAEMRLDSRLYFNDLWTTLAYTHCHTLWTARTRGSFLLARRRYRDPDEPPQGHLPFSANLVSDLARLHAWIEANPEGAWAEFQRRAANSFPPAVRPRTLLLVTGLNPSYLGRLSVPERARFARTSRESAVRLEQLGFAALEVGKDCPASDYADSCHLLESGGAKLAAAVAPRVRQLARRLGYTR
jgi:hypothetical protein